MSNYKKGNFVNLGQMLLGKEKDEEGKASYYIKLDKNAKVTINGVALPEGATLSVQRPETKFKRMAAKGTISEEEAADKIAQFGEEGKLNFVKFEIVAKL